LHDELELCRRYAVKGVHLKEGYPVPPADVPLVSVACHSLPELAQRRLLYPEARFLLSPVFDSVSKKGYHSGFSEEELRQAKGNHLLDERVIALGGITPDNVATVKRYGFGAVASLGYVWGAETPTAGDAPQIINRFLELKHAVDEA
jgi:thiamine-phosphate pyrophosphorylase